MSDHFNTNPAKILSCAPNESVVTDYDRAHFLTYARLLDAADESTDWRKNARTILGCDKTADDKTVRRCWDSHLARARWIIGEGLALVVSAESETGENSAQKQSIHQ
ncbi:DUF2285 domain-containing protein [uncultured Parasphingorhabdus sp.]|uniref:DUF2285 domain-containing protein n=1 Tax=uncultured Parasphingorhabdus sp. TaxID=2709694 RepID=UPI0030DD3A62|tara:strand:- start:4492 stop:4812 length:321 start_codon:yes stop_codon:yes gene_type:complete